MHLKFIEIRMEDGANLLSLLLEYEARFQSQRIVVKRGSSCRWS